jgi:hypothetical protein
VLLLLLLLSLGRAVFLSSLPICQRFPTCFTMTLQVMSLVQGLARDGRTVVATIHSPSAYAFSLFDAVLMLARGRTVYFGPQGEWRP